MKLYIDEDTSQEILLELLQKAGHDVISCFDIGLDEKSDAVQLTQALRDQRVLITYNYDDFNELHVLIGESGGQHAGVIVIRRDNDRARDMSPRGIVNAIGKLQASGAVVTNGFTILNQWR